MDAIKIRHTIRQCILSILEDELSEVPQIIIERRNGKITVASKQRGVEVWVYDFDLKGDEDPDLTSVFGPTGERCLAQCWSETNCVERNDLINKET